MYLYDFLQDSLFACAHLCLSMCGLLPPECFSKFCAINSAMFRPSPAASFADAPAEIAGASDKFKPNNYLQYRVTLSGVCFFITTCKKGYCPTVVLVTY